MRQCEYTLTFILFPALHRFRQGRFSSRAQMPCLGICPDQDHQPDVREAVEQRLPPQGRAPAHGRSIAPIPVIAWKTEPHRHNRHLVAIIENRLVHAEPGPQSASRRIVERGSGRVGQIAGCLACNQDSRTLGCLQDRVRAAGHLAGARRAGPDLFKTDFQVAGHGASIRG